MTLDLEAVQAQLVSATTAGRTLVLLIDIDSALPIPARLRPNDRFHRIISGLAEMQRVFVGFLGRRGLDDLKRRIGMSGVFYAGSDGQELDLLGLRDEPPGAEAARLALSVWADRLESIAARYPGAWVDRQPLAVTVRHDGTSAAEAVLLRRAVRRELVNGGNQLLAEEQTSGTTVRFPPVQDRGTAVERILEVAARDPLPVYVAGTADDAPAVEAVVRAGGITLGVGLDAPPTHLTVPEPAAVLTWFSGLLRALA